MRKVDLIITRHQALIELLIERGIATSETPVHTGTVDIETVRGKHVAGVLPFELAAAAKSVTQIPLAITPDDRGKELPIERLREIAGETKCFLVSCVHAKAADLESSVFTEQDGTTCFELTPAELLQALAGRVISFRNPEMAAGFGIAVFIVAQLGANVGGIETLRERADFYAECADSQGFSQRISERLQNVINTIGIGMLKAEMMTDSEAEAAE